VAVRRLAAFAVLLGVGCGSTRPLEVPPPFEDDGIVVTLKPRAYIDWPFAVESIRGTVENRTGRDVDLGLYLNLVDDKGTVVGRALAFEEDFRRGARRSFEGLAVPGPRRFLDLRLFPDPPPFSKVTRGFVWDQRALKRMLACLNALASWATRPPPQAARPAAQVRGS
jgi:hypothetical protein